MKFKNFFIEYFKYSIVGISCAVIDIGVLAGFLYFFHSQQSFLLAIYNSIAYGMAVLNSYIWNSRYTFKVKKNTKQFIAFIIQALISLLIADGVFLFGLWAFAFVSVFPIWLISAIAKALSMFLSSTASFFFNKYVVFQKSS